LRLEIPANRLLGHVRYAKVWPHNRLVALPPL
jgi:hypothetical protein